MTRPNFHLTRSEVETAIKVAERVERDIPDYPDNRLTLMMDLSAARNSANLNLQRLLDFPAFDFAHDVWGIRTHIDRETGELKDCFLPRASGA